MHHVLEGCGSVIDELISSQFAQEITIARGSGRDDMRPSKSGQLDDEDAHATRTSMDQDALPSDQARVFKEALPGGQSGQRNRCCLHIIKRAWFGSQFERSGNGIFCFGAVSPIV